MFKTLFTLYSVGVCSSMLYLQRTGWQFTGSSNPNPPGVRYISSSYHSHLSSGGSSGGGFFHK